MLSERENGIGHMFREFFDCLRCHTITEFPVISRLPRQCLSAGLEKRDDSSIVRRDQSAADVKRGAAQDLSAFRQSEFGRAAADIDVEDPALPLGGKRNRPGAVGGEQRFEVVAGAGTDEIPALRGEQVGDGARIVAPDGFAGKYDRAGIHLLRSDAGIFIRAVDDEAERLIVDALPARCVRREVDRGEIESLALGYREAARQLPSEPAQHEP